MTGMTSGPVSEAAVDAAMTKIPDMQISLGHWEPAIRRKDMRAALEAAAPHLAAAERERLANRAAMIDEVKNELTDAFQFTRDDGYHFGYVSREWVEALLATHAASAAAAECERWRQLAATMPAQEFRDRLLEDA